MTNAKLIEYLCEIRKSINVSALSQKDQENTDTLTLILDNAWEELNGILIALGHRDGITESSWYARHPEDSKYISGICPNCKEERHLPDDELCEDCVRIEQSRLLESRKQKMA